MRYLLPFLCLFIMGYAKAQSTYEMSDPIDLPEDGWNKVLLLKNGNTMLFHFKNRKAIQIKVYDKAHKEIAHQDHLCKLIDINALDRTFYHGIFEVNGEAVLFLTQEIANRHTLTRLRFDGSSGKLIKEDIVIQSPSFQHKIESYVLRTQDSDNYAVVSFTRTSTREAEGRIVISLYNRKHEMTGELPLDFTDGKFDYIRLAGHSMDERGGILVSVQLSKIVHYPDVSDKYIHLFYLAPGDTQFRRKIMELPREVSEVSTVHSYNPFTESLNICVKNMWSGPVQNGLALKKGLMISRTFVVAKDDFSSTEASIITYKKANEYLQAKTSDKRHFNGSSLFLHTNKVGLTTIISDEFDEDGGRPVILDKEALYNNHVGITQYNDHGEEIWATVLPHQGITCSNCKHQPVLQLKCETQLSETEFLNGKTDFYVLFNERNDNFNNSELNAVVDSTYRIESTKYNYEHTNAVYYSLNKKKEVVKKYLLGTPPADEYRRIYANSGSYSAETNTLATLVSCRKGEKVTTRMAWCHL